MRGSNFTRVHNSTNANIVWVYRSNICPECGDITIEIGDAVHNNNGRNWRRAYPVGANRGPVSKDVPDELAQDYIEACNVLPVSSKASAALSRRCLQNVLHANGYKARDLAKEIDLLLGETDPSKGIPFKLRETIDSIRNFGNFSAHPVDDKTSLQIVDVEPHEAEWCLEILEEIFDHYYVGPAEIKRKRDLLNTKLLSAGKPPVK